MVRACYLVALKNEAMKKTLEFFQVVFKITARNQKLRIMKIVSFFAGAGGLDLGFEKAGFDVVWAN